MKHLILGLLLVGSIADAQDYPLGQKSAPVDRPKPASATIVGVCEKHKQTLMVVVFTFDNGKVLVVDGQNMQGFGSAAEILNYAATAGLITERVQTCGDAST